MFNIFANHNSQMNNQVILSRILMFLLITSAFYTSAQNKPGFGNDFRQLYIMISRQHIDPREANDSLSADLFDDMISLCDPMGLVFLQNEFDSLKEKYRYNLDDEMKSGSPAFFNDFTYCYKNGVDRAERFLDRSAGLPLHLWDNDTLLFNNNKLPVLTKDSAGLQKKWTRYLKYAVLNQLFSKDSATDPVFSLNEKELNDAADKELSRIVLRAHRTIRHFTDQPMGYEEFMKVVMFNLVTGCYDPHSSYFNPELNKWFQAEVSASGYTFGMEIEANVNGDIKVSKLLPGGPAWQSGMINKGDVLLSGQWEKTEKADFTMMSLDDVENYLEKGIEEPCVFEIMKADGQTKEVILHKEKMRQTQDIVRSYVISDVHKIGYIILPAFYNDADENKPGCANDVAREILKLKKENIEGIILDLRYNGGGSIQEALDLAGIFIDVGPVCMFTDPSKKPVVLKDMNRGIAWDGPLMLLVNSYSASASEIVSAALQDHNRALIVGQSTYGKSTGQVVLPIDTTILPDLSNLNLMKKSDGYIKVTDMRIYRIDGSSHQKKGVIPDLEIPDFFASDSETEKDSPYALDNDSISKKAYYTPLPKLPSDSLNQLLSERIQKNEWYRHMAHLSDSLLPYDDQDSILFDMKSFKSRYLEILKISDELSDIFNDFSGTFNVQNHGYDLELIATDEYFRLLNETALKQISEDYEIQEAVNIMNDFIGIIKPEK